MAKDIFLFAAGALLTALAVKLSAASPFWDWVILAGIVLMVSSAAHGLYSRFRGKQKLDPLLGVAFVALAVAIASLGIYAFKGVQTAVPVVSSDPLVINRPITKPTRASLPPSEKERLSNVLYGLSDLLHKASDIGNRTKDFLDKSRSRPIADQRAELGRISQDAGPLYQAIFREYGDKNQYYNRDISNIVQNDGALHALLDALNDYMVTIDYLSDTPQTNALMILQMPAKQIVKANRDVSVWIAEAFKRIDAIRAEISG
ncbi:MAG: hypothetical protein WAM62_01295 [Pseudolabrys sp.]